DLPPLLIGDRQAAPEQNHQQRIGLALGFPFGLALGFPFGLALGFPFRLAAVIGAPVRLGEELLDLGFHRQCLSRSFAQGFLDQQREADEFSPSNRAYARSSSIEVTDKARSNQRSRVASSVHPAICRRCSS